MINLFLLKFEQYYAAQKIGEGRNCNSVMFKGKKYVITGTLSCGAKGIHHLYAHEVVPLDLYKGKLKPMYRDEHQDLVNQRLRERGYNGQIIKCDQIEQVLTDPRIVFTPINETSKQLNLF